MIFVRYSRSPATVDLCPIGKRRKVAIAGEAGTFEVVENSGPNNLRDLLKARFAKASRVDIAVAFITESGLAEIIQPLRQVAAGGNVRLVTGLYQRVTEPKALELLLDVQRETCGRFSICLSREPRFHRKVYLIESRTRAVAIVGSSNLTREGLRSGGELDLMVSLPTAAPSYQRLKAAFDKDWAPDGAVPLTKERIKRYARKRPPSSVGQKTYSKAELREILGKEPTHRGVTDGKLPGDIWRDCITGFVKKRTERIISEVTNWDTKHYDWYSTGRSHPHKKRDQIFLFSLATKRFDLVRVEAVTRTSVPTPDGRHFTAYRPVRGYGRRFSKRLWKQLEVLHIEKNKICGTKKVSAELAKRLKSILRVKNR